MTDNPLNYALELTRTHNQKLYSYVDRLVSNSDIISEFSSGLHDKIAHSDRSKFVTYRTINPEFAVHRTYTRDIHNVTLIPEYLRVDFTRMRLSSHRLRIETGRWSRLPREQRLCRCGAMQDEQHVLQDCALVQHIRDSYRKPVKYPDILRDSNDLQDFKVINDIMTFYQSRV